MKKRNVPMLLLYIFIFLSFTIKLVLIYKYGNRLTLSSDDINYVKSAVALLREGILTYHNYNELTVFVMPLYPLFLAGIFRIFGDGFTGLQAVRVIQAAMSCGVIIYMYLMAKHLSNENTAVMTAFLVAFYIPNITTSGFMLTETLFTLLLAMLLYYSIIFSGRPTAPRFMLLGLLWAVTVLCRPTAAFYPLLFFFTLLVTRTFNMWQITKFGACMALVFILIFSPWWLRNYREYDAFIPLSASSGNPMLQGTYVDYRQTPENAIVYKLGKNAYETNQIEMKIARTRIREEFAKDFWGYLKWFTLEKTRLFWCTVFYWRQYFGISHPLVVYFHKFLLIGFAGILTAMLRQPSRYLLPVLVLLYFNVVHCVYMAFDRYAFPLIPILSMFCAFIIEKIFSLGKKRFAV